MTHVVVNLLMMERSRHDTAAKKNRIYSKSMFNVAGIQNNHIMR